MRFQGCCLLRVRRGCILIIFQRMTTRLKKVKNTSMDPTGYKNPLAMNKYTFSLKPFLIITRDTAKSVKMKVLPLTLLWPTGISGGPAPTTLPKMDFGAVFTSAMA